MTVGHKVTPVFDGSTERFDTEQRLVEQLRQQLRVYQQRTEDLTALGAIITSILEIDKALTVMMEIVMQTVGGEVGAILLEENEVLIPHISWGMPPELVQTLSIIDGASIHEWYSNKAKPQFVNDKNMAPESGAVINSVLVAPIESAQRRHGAVMIINKEKRQKFTEHDCELLVSLNNFLAVALDNSHLVAEKLERERMQRELDIAREVQRTILPANNPAVGHCEIGVVYVPANEVGGDFYDVIPLGDESFFVMVGDVSSKGVGSALVMSACSGIVKSLLQVNPQIGVGKVAAHLNDVLSEGIIKDRDMFATIWFGRVDCKKHALSYCNAGHLPPLMRTNADGNIAELSTGGPVIGQFAGIGFVESEEKLGPGDTVTVFTDGVTEAVNTRDELFGREKVQAFLKKNSSLAPQNFCESLKWEVDKYAYGTGGEHADDLTAMQIKVKGSR